MAIVGNFGQKYSEISGINLKDETDEETFKWFLMSMLFGAPITETSAIKTYKCFQKHDVLTPARAHLDKMLFSEPSDEFHFATPEQLSKPVNLLK